MKRTRCESSGSGSTTPELKRRKVKLETFNKWVRDFDRAHQTASWLDCETEMESGARFVTKLKCRICFEYNASLVGGRNYSDKWVHGADSVKTTNIRDHAKSDQHVRAMNLHKKATAKASGQSPTSYAPIAKALNVMAEGEKEMLLIKFDLAYFIAIEQLAFAKYPKLCELEERHGVSVGTAYRNENACKEFVHYMAESSRQNLSSKISAATFFSLLMDGSTDSSNHENELILVLYCETDCADEKIHSRLSFLTVHRAKSVNAGGLFDSLQYGLRCLGIPCLRKETCSKLVGIATDGAAANIGAAGLRGLVEAELPWVFWMWCLAHRLELAMKDALADTFFDTLDEMLLRLYYIYEKSPKKCRELESVINDLKECFQFDDNGVKPIRASGSRWVSHKLNAMRRILSKYGAYTAHLTQLSVDSSVKPCDRAKLKGYLRKWMDAKYLLGCAIFIDVLTPCSIFSKSMQSDSLDIVGALSCLIRTVKETTKLKSKPLSQWATYSATLKKVTQESGEFVYQCQQLKLFSEAKLYYESKNADYCSKVTECIRSRLEWSNLQLIRDVIVVLATQGWQKIIDLDTAAATTQQEEEDSDPLTAIDRVIEHFAVPLESANVDVGEIKDEFEAMISYAAQFMSLSTMDYKSVWWRLFHAPTSAEWSNALSLAKLLFSLPVSNGKLERLFSQLNLIKTNKRAALSDQALQDLLTLNASKVPLQDYSPDSAIQLWWDAKQRRPNQAQRKKYKQRSVASTSSSSCYSSPTSAASDTEDETQTTFLDDWDQWLEDMQ